MAKRAASAVFVLLVFLAYGLATPAGASLIVNFLQTMPALTAAQWDGLKTGDPAAIVILSAGRRNYAPEYDGETVDELSLERLRYGARLARATGLPVLVSGGLSRGTSPPLAALFAGVLEQDYGIEPRWLEALSSTTHENALYASELLKREGIFRAVLVTHAWHMRRAAASFAAQGITVIPAPTAFYRRRNDSEWQDFLPSAGAFRMSAYAIHEFGGRFWYWVRYGY
jgi:uncharacterized SAM-binding protein YcdF (DUF218 family)